ncbi:MAG: DUF434 domain-containing protein [Planctomycetota bacterium]|jgi:hypothetical protein
MPDKRKHRGPHPEDAALFCKATLDALRAAVSDMSWLLSHGYADKSSLKLVGDRYNLTARQRIGIMRSACSDEQSRIRADKQIEPSTVKDAILLIDGYNLLITVEAALGHAVLLAGRDRCIRDIASIHGTYRKVEETLPAIKTIAHVLGQLAPAGVIWLLDKPVSNSGRLKILIDNYAAGKGLNWQVELAVNPDKQLIESDQIIATGDSVVLDGCQQWVNLARIVLETIAGEWDLNLFRLC